jgi:nucleoside-diphosphate-sugar epimerase
MKRILVTGSVGQIGSELTLKLRNAYGNDNVVAGGHKTKPGMELLEFGPFEVLDCTRPEVIDSVVKKYRIDTIYHLASLLSAVAENDPQLAWQVNVNALVNVLEVGRENKCAVFFPSSIGAFGPTTPADNTPQQTLQRPTTMYGVTKVTGELLCDYYHKKFAVDTRGLRYPGIISHVTLPGGGTTDYAVEIYYEAIKKKKYTSFIKAGTKMDMMYMPDALDAAIDLMEANPDNLFNRNAYNVSAMSFDPDEIATEIKKHIPEFVLDYKVDPCRQGIADSWPNYMDDSVARDEWGWNPKYDLPEMSRDMIEKLTIKLNKQNV